MKNFKRSIPWLIAGFLIANSLAQVLYPPPIQDSVDAGPEEKWLYIGVMVAIFLVTVTFSVVGVLIVTHRSGHFVGWLLLIVPINIAVPIGTIINTFSPSAPDAISPGIWLILWFDGWTWLIMILSVFLILLNFPTGHPPSPHWRWLNFLAAGMIIYQAVIIAFLKDIGPQNGLWQVHNPIGFITETIQYFLTIPFYLALFILAISSVAAIIVRNRRANGIERLQIRWLLFSGVLCFFALVILIGVYAAGLEDTQYGIGSFLLVFLFFLTLPIAIAFAILRYRLYDIDIIIRRTLTYSILTAVLGLVYFGGVVQLQNVFGELFDAANSPLVTVISTLAIAALFNPLRIRIQEIIDRRFFRSKYDAEKALTDFAAIVRDEVDMVRLSGSLLFVVEKTMQPDQTSLWLKKTK